MQIVRAVTPKDNKPKYKEGELKMLTVLKKNGAKSTAGDVAKKGSKGRLELFATRNEDGTYGVHFADFGNYGKVRWEADFGKLDRADIAGLIAELSSLVSGEVSDTHISFESLAALEDAVPASTEASAAPAETPAADSADAPRA